MKWLPSENDLVKEQTDFRNKVWTENGNVYISGFPGSGKSVCLLYAVKTIKDKKPDASILFIEYTHTLIKMIQAALTELEFNDVPVVTYDDFRLNYFGPYDFIICDEAQDISQQCVELMKMRAKRIIVGGDSNQSIYEKLRVGEPTISTDELKRLLEPVTANLTIIHRISKYIVRGILSYMPEMKILENKISMLKKHYPIYVWHCVNQTDEVKRIMEDAKTALNFGESVAVLLPTHNKIENFVNLYMQAAGFPSFDFSQDRQYGKPNYGLLNQHLAKHGVKMQCITNGFGSLETDSHKIILSTYHSSKGLDFENVFLPFCNYYGMEVEKSKRLFMVAMTRSRKRLTISYTNQPNVYLEKFYQKRDICIFIDFKDMAKGPSIFNNSDDEDDW